MPPTSDLRLPTGTVTFLFTDIEGSTRLVSTLGDQYGAVLEEHHRLLRDAIAGHGGTEVGTEGDAFFAVFASALDAVAAATQAQRALAVTSSSQPASVRVRMGLHTGEGRLGADSYIGLDVHRAARIAAAGHGGQVLLSDATRALAAPGLPDGLATRDLGEHRLKDLPVPEHLWQLEIDGLDHEFPALKSLDARPHSLPPPSTSLIGREGELGSIAELLHRRRLVTLTGPGGTGKTRLALAVAERLLTAFRDGAFFVALQDARDRATVGAAIASALGVRETLERDLEQGVKEHLRERELLLVLDNFEQVIVASPLVAELLAASPMLRVLVTSRELLHLAGEQAFDVPPLAMPDPGHLPPLSALSQYEAVALFIERARAAKQDFAVTNENAPAVAEISHRLDGLPLAIELAAARVRILSPEAILERLELRLPLLTTGARDVPDRQRTLRGAIDWSYQLLDAAGQRLFARLAVFAGTWTIDAAEAACNPDGELDVFDGLASLADKSLIRAVTDGGEARFSMLQTVREFADEKLDAEADAHEVRRRHARYVLALTESAEPELRRTALRDWQHRLRRDEENVRAALRWSLHGGEIDVGLRTAGALFDYWHYWGDLREGRRWLESLLGLPDATEPTLGRARALSALAGIVYWQGDGDRAWDLYEEALAVYRRLGADRAVAQALHNSGWAAVARYDFAAARERGTEAIELYRQIGDSENAELVAAWLAIEPVIMGMGGSAEAALAATREAIEVNRRLGRMHDATDYLTGYAMIYRMVAEYERAGQASRDALRAWHEIGNVGRIPICLKILAAVDLAQGRPARAATLGAAAERYNDAFGGELAEAFGQVGDSVEGARPLLTEAEHAGAVEAGRSMSLEEVIEFALGPEASQESTA